MDGYNKGKPSDFEMHGYTDGQSAIQVLYYQKRLKRKERKGLLKRFWLMEVGST